MKHLSITIIVLVSLFFLSSCLKEYACQCTQGSLTMKAMTKRDAKRGCEVGGGHDQDDNPYCTLP